MRPWVILLVGAVFAGAGFSAAKLWRSVQDGPCSGAPRVQAVDVLGDGGGRAVTGGELGGVRESQPPAVRRAFLPADAADTGRGDAVVRVTVLVSDDAEVGGAAVARDYGLDDGNSSPVAIGDGTGRLAGGDRSVAVGALDGCTGVVVAGGAARGVERVAAGLRAP